MLSEVDLDEENLKLPDPVEAVDGTLIYQPLIMKRWHVELDEVDFFFQLHPKLVDACPQYLVIARWHLLRSLLFFCSLSL